MRALGLALCAAAVSPVFHARGAGAAPGGPTLRDLSPVQVYAVPSVTVAPPRPLPDSGAGAGAGAGAGIRAARDLTATELADERLVRNASMDNPVLNLRFSPEDAGPGLLGGPAHLGFHEEAGSLAPAGTAVLRRRPRWLSATPLTDTWVRGARNWSYRQASGLGLVVGSDALAAPAWGDSVRLGGLRISRRAPGDAGLDDPWQYSVMVGALEAPSSQPGPGGLQYGSAASNTLVRYTLNPQFTLESQVQWAPDMVATGLGGEYDSRIWGVWTAGVARASRSLHQGWRYRVGYKMDLPGDLNLSWVNEQRTGGFSDLSNYQGFAADAGRTSNHWTATLATGRWGDVSGSYEESHAAAGALERRFGLTQQFWYSPNLRVALQADRDAISGDYGVGLRFSVPLE